MEPKDFTPLLVLEIIVVCIVVLALGYRGIDSPDAASANAGIALVWTFACASVAFVAKSNRSIAGSIAISVAYVLPLALAIVYVDPLLP